MQHKTLYTVGFAALVCLVCSIIVSSTAVSLKEKQEANQVLDRQKKVLQLVGLMQPGERLKADEIRARYSKNIKARLVELKTGSYVDGVDVASYDQRRATKDPATSRKAPANDAQVARLPNQAVVYMLMKGGQPDQLILPVEGKGLWSTLYGFLALARDTNTVKGITFYEHGETPGLGGEVDNPKWKSLWPDRKAFDASGNVALSVTKGQAGPPGADPHRVDGLSGATITSRGVSHLVQFWLGEHGFGPYLQKFRGSDAHGNG